MDKEDKYLVVQGKKHRVEWYFDERGRSQAKEYYEKYEREIGKKFSYIVKILADKGEVKNKTQCNFEGDGIWAIKPKPHRSLFFFYEDGKIIIGNAFVKKKDKLDPNEKDRIVRVRDNYRNRRKSGSYYGKKC